MQREQSADVGGDPLAAVEAQPHGEEVAEEGAEAGDVGELERVEGHVALGDLVDQQHGDRALQPSSSSVAAASPLLPVRSTLVAPMLPEPILRTSPRPAACVSSRPNGIEPSR